MLYQVEPTPKHMNPIFAVFVSEKKGIYNAKSRDTNRATSSLKH